MTTSSNSILVGVNGSDSDDLAIAWALDEAGASDRRLRLVYAYQAPPMYETGPVYSRGPDYGLDDDESAHTLAEKVLADLVDGVARANPSIEVSGDAIDGTAVDVLTRESNQASLLVLGTRPTNVLGFVMGSVANAVAARAGCPAVVTRGAAGLPAQRAAVVVGIDGHDDWTAQTLLEFGFDYASRHGAPLRAVLCWHSDALAAKEWRRQGPLPERVQCWLAEALTGWREKYPDVEADVATISAHPTAGLVGESLNQRLLVVGNRGRHALSGTLLGSVSQGVLHHAGCPVAIVATH